MPGGSGGSERVLPDRAGQPSSRWSDLRLRVVSAAILAPVALLCVWYGGWLFGAMVLAAFAGIVWEWGAMCRWRPLPMVLGTGYALLALCSLWGWRQVGGAKAIYVLLAIVWCSDIGAYAVGRLVGGRRLAPSVSPGKTWSGAAGGLVAAIMAGFLVSGTASPLVAAVAAILGVASQLGDLGESAVKRHYQVKDSGRLIPGHGGLLDRLDGLMAAAIVAGVFLIRIGLSMGPTGAVL